MKLEGPSRTRWLEQYLSKCRCQRCNKRLIQPIKVMRLVTNGEPGFICESCSLLIFP